MNSDLTKDRILTKLVELERYSKELTSALPKSAAEYKKSDMFIKSTVERRLQLISDTEIDIFALIYKKIKLKIVGGDESLINSMSEVLNTSVLEKTKRLRRLRNMLIHEYKSEKFDEEVFVTAAENLDQHALITEIKSVLKE